MKKKFFRATGTLILLFYFFLPLKSQDKNIKFYDVIQDDSVVMYFNSSYSLTESYCANFKRYTRVDKNGDFFQSFTDSFVQQHNIAAKGFYTAGGAKNGYFELYYPNGNIKCKGNYKNNIEDGMWEFYYPDGKPERKVLCTATAFFLIEFIDKNGNVTVKDGNGFFNNGRVTADVPEYTVITASGTIVNGGPDGEWTSKFGNVVYCNEVFKDGKFVSGDCPGSFKPEKRNYKTVSILNSFFIPTYFYDLEQFKIVSCPDTAMYSGRIKGKMQDYSFNMSMLTSSAWDEIKNVMDFQKRGHNTEEYVTGENMLTISFSVNDKGVPVNYKRTTAWGDQFYDPLIRVISKYAKFPPTKELLFFHFALTINEGNTMGYQIYFSRE